MGAKISRRHLLALSLAMGAAATLGAGATLISWWKVSPDQPYATLSTEEAAIIVALAEAAFPGGNASPLDGGDAHLDRFMDELLTSMGEPNKSLLRVLLHAIDTTAILNGVPTFRKMSVEQRQVQINKWANAKNHLWRSAILSLITLMGMGYTTHPTVAERLSEYHMCGYG